MATTGELATAAEHVRAFYRALAVVSADDALVENGEAADDVAYLSLTRGYRATQRWLIAQGAGERWRKRSGAITTWSGSDTADGGRFVDLDDYCTNSASPPACDFLRLDGDQKSRSALVQANGDQWGSEIEADQDWAKGNYYYLKGEQLWLARGASPPSGLLIRYYYTHPPIVAGTAAFDMQVDLRWLCVAEAVYAAVWEGWVPGGDNTRQSALGARENARREALRIYRRTREPQRFAPVTVRASHW
jgi:hypothetical protein